MKRRLLHILAIVTFNLLMVPWASADNAWLNAMIEKKAEGRVEAKSLSTANAFNKTHSLIFFYASTCQHCHHFAPVLQSFAEKSGLSVLPLSFDNAPIEGFNRFELVTTEWVNVAFEGKEIRYPALFIINQKTNALYPVSFGALTYDELQSRMQVLIPKIEAYEERGEA